MNNTLITTIRFGAVLGIALFAFVGEVFAAPTITPVAVKAYSDTAVILSAKAATPTWTTTPVWFEYADTPNPTIAAGMTSVFSKGGTFEPFETRVSDLKPGTTYYFRAVATEGGTTVYTPVVAYTVPGGSSTTSNTSNTNTNNTTNTSSNTNTNTNTNTTTTNVVRETVVITTPAPAKKVASATTVVTPASTATVTADSANQVVNPNSAAVIGADGMFPQSLIGWIGLLLALLIVVILMKMVVESFEANHAVVVKHTDEEDEEEKTH